MIAQGRQSHASEHAARRPGSALANADPPAALARLRVAPLANSCEAIIGVSVSATRHENSTAAASVKPNSLNSRPTRPAGRRSARTPPTAPAWSRSPQSRSRGCRRSPRAGSARHARCAGGCSRARRSHRRPPGRSRAPCRATSATLIDEAQRVHRRAGGDDRDRDRDRRDQRGAQLPRNAKITTSTRISEMPSAIITSRIAASMNTARVDVHRKLGALRHVVAA